MQAVERGLAFAEGNGDRFYCAELHRLRGELLAHPSMARRQAAKASFHTAIRIAQEQGACALERRAQQSLAAWTAGGSGAHTSL
jgi:hypothetical protein